MLEALQMFEFIEDEAIRQQANEYYEAQMKAVNENVQSQIDEAIHGLKSKNEELLGEKKTIQEKLLMFKDIKDPKKALEALTFIEESEEAQMIRDGKFDELLEKRTSTMRIEHENKVNDLLQKYEDTSKTAHTFQSLYETKMMDDAMRREAVRAGVRSEAIEDVLLRAKNIYTLDANGVPEARDAKGSLRKNEKDNVLTPSVWLEDLKSSSPHYWPSSEGIGAVGGNITNSADLTAKLADYAAKGMMPEYRALRSKMKQGAVS